LSSRIGDGGYEGSSLIKGSPYGRHQVNRLYITHHQINQIISLARDGSLHAEGIPGASSQLKTSTLESINSELELVVQQLSAFAKDYQRKKDREITISVRRAKWIWGRAKVQALRERVKDIRSQLQLELNTMAMWNQR
jgi:hypothetical protein